MTFKFSVFLIIRNGQLVDRQFMVVDKKGKMITTRRYSNMVLIQPKMTSNNHLTLSYPGREDVTIDLDDVGDSVIDCNVWGEDCAGVDCGDEVSSWLSGVILDSNTPQLRLVFHKDGSTSRPVKEDRQEQ